MNTTFNLKSISVILLFGGAIFLSKSCGSRAFGLQTDSLFLITKNLSIIYDIKNPDEKHFLPYVLSEVSGLSYLRGKSLLAVDDETGRVFEYDVEKREIIHSIDFSNRGDYEGVEVINDKIYVLESDGDIFSFDYSKTKKAESKKYENDLTRGNDTEGLGYDPLSNSLLIACKEKGNIEKNNSKGRSIYAFNLDEKKLSKEPLFSIKPKDIKEFWEENRDFNYEEERIKFKPSAIAFHPIDKKFYILSSVGKMLIVVERDGQIKATYPISPGVLSQPEGICFAPNGDMYISSEGGGDKGYILKFSMIEK